MQGVKFAICALLSLSLQKAATLTCIPVHLFTYSPGHLLICCQLLKNSLWHLADVFVSWCCCYKLPRTGWPKIADIYSLIKIHNEGLAISCSLWRVLGGSLPCLFLAALVSPGVPRFQLMVPVSASPSHGTFPVCLCLSSLGHQSFDLGPMPIQDDHFLTNYICIDPTPKSDLWFQVDINFGGWLIQTPAV